MNKNYTIGLDIGSASVGWSVVTDDYDLIKKKMVVKGNTGKKATKKNFWGVRLFSEGETAADRRMNRVTRRRYTRRKQRLLYLQEIFSLEMYQVDKNFFNRLNESFLNLEDKVNSKHPFFGTLEEELEYHTNYPTIYHLRKELVDSKEKKDLRLVYLAMAHTIKYRGHFLLENDLNTDNISISENYKEFIHIFNDVVNQANDGTYRKYFDPNIQVEDILAKQISRTRKFEEVLSLYEGEKSNDILAQFLKMIVGNQGNLKKYFDLEEETKLQFSKEEYEEDVESLLGIIGDEYADLFVAAKKTYDSIELSGILTTKNKETKAKLSTSMVDRYTEHKTDLVKLKVFFKKYLSEEYKEFFTDCTKNGYAGYINGSVTQMDFYKYTNKLIGSFEESSYFLDKIEQESFLRKQRTFDNGVIPHQIHLEELEEMLNNQGKYYPFLKENKEKISQILTFRIPYYVGPLGKNDNSNFSWLERFSDEKITPWNFDKVVDTSASAVKFIERMTNMDTYLLDEPVLPQKSMLYQKYMVFNELTKIKYFDETETKHNLSSQEKMDVFNHLFLENRRVTIKMLEDFLSKEYQLSDVKVDSKEKSFNATFSTYHDFIKLGVSPSMLQDPDNEKMFEEIIKILTIFEDKIMIREQLQPYASYFSQQTLKNMEKRKFTGWGRFSQKLIDGIFDKESHKTILDYLMDDDGVRNHINRNFMQLINDQELSFKQSIAKHVESLEQKGIEETVRELTGSPAIKKGILQSIKIVDEIIEIMGYLPTNIVIEMARENQVTSRTTNRLKQLEKSLSEINSDLLKKHPTTKDELTKDRLFLYYLQNGRDIYTGKELDINNLSKYDIDHIIPKSFIKDDSLDNRVLTSSKENRGKLDDVPDQETVFKQKKTWEILLAAGLMNKRKFDNLTKSEHGGLSEEDKQGFIQRQLVETRQITKTVAQLLDSKYNTGRDERGNVERQVNIITLKAVLTSQFRETFSLAKVREVNDYHHAHDAYLNAVVAQTLLKVYPNLKAEFVYGEYFKGNLFHERKASAKKQMYTNIMKFYQKERTITDPMTGEILWDNQYLAKIRKVLNYRQMNIVKKVEKQTGRFTKESIRPKSNTAKLVPRKRNWPVEQYGGFIEPTISYSVIVFHDGEKKAGRMASLVGIRLLDKELFEDKTNQKNFLEKQGYLNPVVKVTLPKFSLIEFENGKRRMLSSDKELQKGNQMFLPSKMMKLLSDFQKVLKDKNEVLILELENKRHLFDVLFYDYIIPFGNEYIKAPTNIKKIEKVYLKHKDDSIEEVAEAFVKLLSLNKMGAASEFTFFDTKIGRTRYTTKSDINEIFNGELVFQSITGLRETRIKVAE